jgi:hypothetical protein
MGGLSQIDHIVIERRWHSSILDVRSFRGTDCDTDHCLVVVKFSEKLVLSRKAAHTFGDERFYFRTLK